MRRNVTRKLIASHLVSGEPTRGESITVRVDQGLTRHAMRSYRVGHGLSRRQVDMVLAGGLIPECRRTLAGG